MKKKWANALKKVLEKKEGIYKVKITKGNYNNTLKVLVSSIYTFNRMLAFSSENDMYNLSPEPDETDNSDRWTVMNPSVQKGKDADKYLAFDIYWIDDYECEYEDEAPEDEEMEWLVSNLDKLLKDRREKA